MSVMACPPARHRVGAATAKLMPAPTRSPWCRAPACSRCPELPRSRRTRSRMLARPRLARSRDCAGSKPLPLSATASCSPRSRGDSNTVTALARPWRVALLSASCATRNRHSDVSLGTALGTPCASTSTRTSPLCATRSHSARSASTSPRSSSTDGCSRYDIACTSSLRCARSLRMAAASAPAVRSSGRRRWPGAPGAASGRRAVRARGGGARLRAR